MCDKDTLQTEEIKKMFFIKTDCAKEAALFELWKKDVCKFVKDHKK